MCALGVGEGAETTAFEFFGERTELDFEVLRRGRELSVIVVLDKSTMHQLADMQNGELALMADMGF